MYLRESLAFNEIDKITTLENELQFVNNYFNIEKARFGEKIKLIKKINAPLNKGIPALMLQPLVENAVRHGISKKVDGGTVEIIITEKDNGLLIEIKDDGVGIKKEKLDNLLDENTKAKSIGLLNIQARLLRLYEKGLEIESKVREGTTVRFWVGGNDND